jgi:hypothetical protein
MNNVFSVAFAIIGTGALGGAIFAGATWHYGTAAICLVLILLFVSENKAIKNQKS